MYKQDPLGGIDPALLIEETSNKRVGQRIRKIRISQGMSQSDLGAKVGLNANRIQQYENGARKARYDLTKKIAKALGVEPMALVDPQPSNEISAMYTLFEMEELYGLRIEPQKDCMVLRFGKKFDQANSEQMNHYLNYWYLTQQQRDKEMDAAATPLEKDQALHNYHMWEWTFPRPRSKKQEKEQRKERLRAKIQQLQEELEQLERTE